MPGVDMILMEVSQRAYDMIHYISGLYGYLYVCEIYVNLIWYLYLFMLNKICLSLSVNHTHINFLLMAITLYDTRTGQEKPAPLTRKWMFY